MNTAYEPHPVNKRDEQIETLIVLFVIVAIVEAEIAVALVVPLIGVILHAAIIITVTNIYLFIPSLPHRRALLPLILLPILRLLSLTIPIPPLPRIDWYAAIGLPLILSASVVIWIIRPSMSVFSLNRRSMITQLAFGSIGIPLAYLVFRIDPVKPIVAAGDWRSLVLGALYLTIFAGFAEELVFRFLIQGSFVTVFGKAGVIAAALLSGTMYISTLSRPLVIFWMIAGLGFGIWVYWSRSIWGVVLAHSLIVIGAILVLPALSG